MDPNVNTSAWTNDARKDLKWTHFRRHLPWSPEKPLYDPRMILESGRVACSEEMWNRRSSPFSDIDGTHGNMMGAEEGSRDLRTRGFAGSRRRSFAGLFFGRVSQTPIDELYV